MGAASFSPSPMTTMPFIWTVLMSWRIALTARGRHRRRRSCRHGRPSAPRPSQPASVSPGELHRQVAVGRMRVLAPAQALRQCLASPPAAPGRIGQCPGAPATPDGTPGSAAAHDRRSWPNAPSLSAGRGGILCSRLASRPLPPRIGAMPEDAGANDNSTRRRTRPNFADRGSARRVPVLPGGRARGFHARGLRRRAGVTDIVALAGASVGSLYHSISPAQGRPVPGAVRGTP